MGIILSNRIRQICSPYEETSARILVLGLDSAGKTTLVQRFKNLVDLQLNTTASFIDHIPTQPTFVYHIETVYPRLAPIALTLWDLGGQEKTRELWRFYFTDVQGRLVRRKGNEEIFHLTKTLGVVFVIDCHDSERITVAREALCHVSEKIGRSTTIPIIIAANKQDLSSMN